jgi:putative ABC transport system substrate-binding protein
MTPELTAKRLDLLNELLPKASNVAVVWNPDYSAYVADWRDLRTRADAQGVTLRSVEIRNPADLDRAFATIANERPDTILTLSDTLTYALALRVAGLATGNGFPLITPFRETTEAGGLMSYGPNIPDMYRQAAGYVDKILKGAKPADLPVEQPTKFELVLNLKTAKALSIDVPPTLLARADEVIE